MSNVRGINGKNRQCNLIVSKRLYREKYMRSNQKQIWCQGFYFSSRRLNPTKAQPSRKCDEKKTKKTKYLHTISIGLKYIIEFMYVFFSHFGFIPLAQWICVSRWHFSCNNYVDSDDDRTHKSEISAFSIFSHIHFMRQYEIE